MALRWWLGGVVAIAIGLTVWATAFVLVPLGVALLAIGVNEMVRPVAFDARGPRRRVDAANGSHMGAPSLRRGERLELVEPGGGEPGNHQERPHDDDQQPRGSGVGRTPSAAIHSST